MFDSWTVHLGCDFMHYYYYYCLVYCNNIITSEAGRGIGLCWESHTFMMCVCE